MILRVWSKLMKVATATHGALLFIWYAGVRDRAGLVAWHNGPKMDTQAHRWFIHSRHQWDNDLFVETLSEAPGVFVSERQVLYAEYLLEEDEWHTS